MRKGKRRIAFALAFFLLLALAPSARAAEPRNPTAAADSRLASGRLVTWDCVWFGSYPQREVTEVREPLLHQALQEMQGENGSCLTLDGQRYLCLSSIQGGIEIRRYFAFEPIKWRVLSVSGGQAFLLADAVIDCAPYSQDGSPADWVDCSLRDRLNDAETGKDSFTDLGFAAAAFSEEERNAIALTEVTADSGGNTWDRIFLLSKPESTTEALGFSFRSADEDEGRRTETTAYTAAIGAQGDDWWLRSSCASAQIVYHVTGKGSECYGTDDYGLAYGLRPALRLSLNSSVWSSAGTVSSDGSVNETAPSENIPGDMNGDGRITLADVSLLFACVCEPENDGLLQGDLNKDGRVSLQDVSLLFRMAT